jgi:carboxymethylenebutenolidase
MRVAGKAVPPDLVVIVGVENGKIAYEHIYWDQATVLVQLGLLDPAGLPVAGREAAAQLTNPAISGPHP